MKFTAIRNTLEDTIIATMTCDDIVAFTEKEFLKNLKNAITQWIKYDVIGQKALNYSGGDFNFGDLALFFENPALKEELSLQNIVNFNITISSSKESSFDFDLFLINR